MTNSNCRVCGEIGIFYGLLFKCTNCVAVHWDKTKLRKLFNKIEKNSPEWNSIKTSILKDAKTPKSNGHYVYTLRLKSKPNYLYVGLTGMHPYERYLNHIIGHKASKYAKKYATVLIEYEGPMKYDIAVEREKSRANEWRADDYRVEGAPV